VGVSFLSHGGLLVVEAQINIFKLVIAFYLTFDPNKLLGIFEITGATSD
jgi:hypothetical protein